jgi:hypothetical protein
MAEDDPAFLSYGRQPFVVWRVMLKSELVFGIMVIFDAKRRLRCPE